MQTLALGTGVATEFHKIMTNHMNPFSAGPDVRAGLISDLNIPVYEKGKTEYLLWLGCVWSYNADYKKVVEAVVTLFNKAGVSYGVLKEEKCSGHHSRKQGEEMAFQMLAEENVEQLKQFDVHKIVTGCPHCLNTLRHDYTELEAPAKARYVKLTNVFTHDEGNFAVKDFRIFGNPDVAKFTKVTDVTVVRDPEDQRDVTL